MISTQPKFMLAAVVVSLVFCGSQCAAGIIAYNNLPLAPFNRTSSSGIGTILGFVAQSAQRFTPASSGKLATLDLAISFGGDPFGADDLTLTIVSDDNGLPSAAELWSQTYIDKVRSHFSPAEAVTALSFDAEDGLTLQAGTSYWLITAANPVHAEYNHFWVNTPNATADPRALHISNTHPNFPDWPVGEWFLQDGAPLGLRITVIPEPAAAALILAASATLLAVRRRAVSL